MPEGIDKRLVRERFRRCLPTYDAHAGVQRGMAEHLVRRLRATCGASFPRALEVGCGTGLLSRELLRSVPLDELCLNDLVPECRSTAESLAAAFAGVRIRFLAGDIETLRRLPAGGFDLIASSAAFQWVRDLPALLVRLDAALGARGVLAFHTFGPENLREVRAVTGDSLPYHSPEAMQRMIPPALETVVCEDSLVTLSFPSPRDALEHLAKTGSNAVTRRAWTRRALADFDDGYRRRFACGGSVPLTYHPVLLIARRSEPHVGSVRHRH